MPSQHTGSQSIMGKTVSGANSQTSYWVSHSCTDPFCPDGLTDSDREEDMSRGAQSFPLWAWLRAHLSLRESAPRTRGVLHWQDGTPGFSQEGVLRGRLGGGLGLNFPKRPLISSPEPISR